MYLLSISQYTDYFVRHVISAIVIKLKLKRRRAKVNSVTFFSRRFFEFDKDTLKCLTPGFFTASIFHGTFL
jgi:hypothetical protein